MVPPGRTNDLKEHFMKHLPAEVSEQLDCGCALDDGAFDSLDDKLKAVGFDG